VRYLPASVLTHLESASVTDVEHRDEQVRAGWATLRSRWDGAFPSPPWRHRPPERLEEAAPIAVAATASELLADPELLRAWASVFAGGATLVVLADEHETELLADAVPDGADLLAVPPDDAAAVLADAVDAYYGARAAPGALARLPRVVPAALPALQAAA